MPNLTADGDVLILDLGEDENRFSPDLLDATMTALEEIATADGPAALVTIGTGKFFSNGLDLDWLGAHPNEMGSYVARVQELYIRVLTLPVPTIAAVNGHAFGAGAMLAAAHDFRVMREDRGFFCLPEVDIQIPFTEGMAALLQAKLTPATATEAMTTGRRYGGADALTAGIVDAVAAEAELRATAIERIRPLAGKHRETLAAIKATMHASVIEALRRG